MWESPNWRQGIAMRWDTITEGNLEEHVARSALKGSQPESNGNLLRGWGLGHCDQRSPQQNPASYTCNPSNWEAKQEDRCKFKASTKTKTQINNVKQNQMSTRQRKPVVRSLRMPCFPLSRNTGSLDKNAKLPCGLT